MSDEVRRKYIASSQITSVITEPTPTHLLNDALGVIATEITKFKTKVNKGNTLTLPEARVLQGYIKALVELSKEKREAFDQKDLANYSDSELAEIIKKLIPVEIKEKK